jgi:lipoprotein-anchoring transpeptidase ErfK/SrfK
LPSRRLAAGLAVVVVAAGALAWGLTRPDGDDPPAERAAPTTTTAPATTAPPTTQPPAPALVATVKVPEIEAFATAAEGAEVVATLSDRTDFGLTRTFLVAEQQGDWLRVLLPVRPNGSTGWVRAADVDTATTTYSVKVELAAHKVTLYDAGRPVLETGAVVGASDTPTPPGTYYVTDPVDLRDEPNGAYGAFALGLSGFSEVLYEFAGGPGQLALHGTNQPDQVGQDISNGCVRVPNDIIVQIADRVPLGTPVEIVA